MEFMDDSFEAINYFFEEEKWKRGNEREESDDDGWDGIVRLLFFFSLSDDLCFSSGQKEKKEAMIER